MTVHAACEVARLKLDLYRISDGPAPEPAPSFPERLWRKGKRSFFDRYFRPSCGAIESAIDPSTKERTWDPRVYMGLVRSAVMKPFSTRVCPEDDAAAGPGACTGRCQASPVACDRGCLAGSRVCHDLRCSGLPSWWDQWYGPDARVPGALDAFRRVGDAITPKEIVGAVMGCDGGKSPGPDGLSVDLLKLLVSDPSSHHSGSATRDEREVPIARMLADLASTSLRLGRMTEHVTDGLIVMIPKGPIDGPPDVSEMRPITLLSEIGKMPARVLSDRISAVLCAHPELLNINQRAFLRNGDVSQCVAALVDVFEDHHAKVARDPAAELFCVSYDLSKAYDSVQEYSIRATLERFSFPANFVDYVCSSLRNSRSRVRTRDGPSEPFDVKSCVRQGDPLAPLVFILVFDALHCGVNRLCDGDGRHGVQMANGPRLGSMGYADDTAIVATSDASIRVLHDWVCSFFGAHAFKINTKKTKFVVSRAPAGVPCLIGVDGRSHIRALSSDVPFRYLGVMVNMDLTWGAELKRLEKLFWFVHGRLKNHRVPIAPAVDAVNSFLVPKLEAGLALLPLSSTVRRTLNRWTGALADAAMNASSPHRVAGVPRAGFCTVTDMADLASAADIARVAGAFERLNVRANYVTPTTRARWESRSGESGTPNRIFLSPASGVVIRLNVTYSDPDLPIVPTREPAGAFVQLRASGVSWGVGDPVTMFVTPLQLWLRAFTDGSSIPGARRPGGWSSVIFDARTGVGLRLVVM